MRTTITLDEDVERKLDAEVRRRKDATFKDIVNETLRIGRGLSSPPLILSFMADDHGIHSHQH